MRQLNIMRKGERWARQIARIENMILILECYRAFYAFKIKEECLRHKISYSDAETFVNTFSEIFKLDMKVADIVANEDENYNEIIELHEQLKEKLNEIEARCFPFTKEDMMSFMEYEYRNYPLLSMRHYEWNSFSLWCLLSAKRIYSVKEIIPKCVEIQIWNGGKIKQVDTWLFRKAFIKLEKDFWEIVAKRTVRNRKKKK